jgi:signal transduction histidine kinase
MNIWIIIGIGIVVIGGVLYAIYKHKINKAREQQRLTLTQNISHELKTPVASIRGALEIILMHPDMDEDQRREFIERAYQQSGRLANLVEDISTINKLDTQTDFYNRLQLDLFTIVENVLQDLSFVTATFKGKSTTEKLTYPKFQWVLHASLLVLVKRL